MRQWKPELVMAIVEKHGFTIINPRLASLLADMLNEQLPPPHVPTEDDVRVVWHPAYRPTV